MDNSPFIKYGLPAVTIGLLILVFVLNFIGIDSISGFPLLDAGDFSLGILAAGNFAVGVFAVGTFAVGIFAAGIFSLGVFSIGIFSLGLVALGLYRTGMFGKSSSDQDDSVL